MPDKDFHLHYTGYKGVQRNLKGASNSKTNVWISLLLLMKNNFEEIKVCI